MNIGANRQMMIYIPFYRISGASSNDDEKNMNHGFDNIIVSYQRSQIFQYFCNDCHENGCDQCVGDTSIFERKFLIFL